jgi:hypothetical protein
MKFTTLLSVFVLVGTAGSVLAQQTNKAPATASAPKLSTMGSGNEPGALPTEEEIQAFVSSYKESETSKESLSLSVRFGTQQVPVAQKKKYESSKKVPYALYVDLIKTKEVNGKQVSTRTTNGKCGVAILDEAGKVVKQSSENLIKLCAS